MFTSRQRRYRQPKSRGHHIFFIVLADRPRVSCKRTFLKPGLRVERRPCVLVWTANLHTLRIDDAMAPPLDLLTPQGLITTTAMADYVLVFVLQKTWSLSGLLWQDILLQRIMDNRRAIFVFFLSCSPSTVCLYTAQVFIHMLHRFSSVFGEFQAPPIGLEHKLQRFKSFPVDPFGHKYS